MVKAEIERASGVPMDAQRLLCRGRVLNDETNMERARVEDGDTLLLVQSAPAVNDTNTTNDALRDDPHAPDNVENNRMRGMMGFPPPGTAGAGMGTIGDLSQMIASMLAAVPFSTTTGGTGGGNGGVGGDGTQNGGAVTLEFAIGTPMMGMGPPGVVGAQPGVVRGTEGGQRFRGAGGRGAAEREAAGRTDEVLRRYLDNLRGTLERVRGSAPQMPPVDAGTQEAATATATASEATPASEPAASRAREGGALHYGVQCDACEVSPLRGARYKSVAHDDYDLCATCFAAGRGTECGPFTRLDLPLPAGLPPVVINPEADTAREGRRTPREDSEVELSNLSAMINSAAEIAREAAPLMANVAERFSAQNRQNTVETQAQSLQVAALMHSIGALWCELARSIAVVPPPPDAMTPEGAVVAGDDMNSTRSLFSYPSLAYISSSGEFAHTRPPGMPLHENGQQRGQQAARPTNMMRIRTVNGPEFEGIEALPQELQAYLRQQAQAAETQANAAAPTAAATGNDAAQRPANAQRAPPTENGNGSGTQGRVLSRLLGNIMRVIPGPSFVATTQPPNASRTAPASNTGATTQTNPRDSTAAQRVDMVRDLVSQVIGSPTSQNANQAATTQSDATQSDAGNAAPAERTQTTQAASGEALRRQALAQSNAAANAPSTRSRARNEPTDEEANDRAAKASNTGNGMSPAASAARRAANASGSQETSRASEKENDGDDMNE